MTTGKKSLIWRRQLDSFLKPGPVPYGQGLSARGRVLGGEASDRVESPRDFKLVSRPQLPNGYSNSSPAYITQCGGMNKVQRQALGE